MRCKLLASTIVLASYIFLPGCSDAMISKMLSSATKDSILQLCDNDATCIADINNQWTSCWKKSDDSGFLEAPTGSTQEDQENDNFNDRLITCFTNAEGGKWFYLKSKGAKHVTSEEEINSCLEGSNRIAYLLHNHETEALIEETPPVVYEAIKNSKELKAFQNNAAKLKSEKADISVVFHPPESILLSEGEYFGAIAYDGCVKIGSQQYGLKSFFIGWKKQGSDRWYYLDGNNIDQSKLKSLFKAYHGGLALPVRKKLRRCI